MCGIAGYVNLDPAHPAVEAVVQAMTRTLTHRGPDEEGYHLDGPAALGMRRLSIIDLSTGRQPIANEDGTVQLVFNGEVYNHLELRAELEARGHRFRTRADTEVIVHLYEEYGDAFVGRLNAMCALALWDARRRRLVLARDRMGKKPLHYALTPEAFVFGSEPKALLRHPAVKGSLDEASMARYLVHEYVPCPRSIFRGVAKLRPGHIGVLEGGVFREIPYWDIPAPEEAVPAHIEETLRETVSAAVSCRLMSDVPLGVFLSGGVDSTSIVACMAKAAKEVRTFSVAFDDASFDESAHFRSVARHYGTRHEERVLTADALLELLPALAPLLDEPLGDASILPTHMLSRFTREHVTVALGGDGGDELFAGYPTYQAHRLAGWYERLPSALKAGVVEPLVRALPVSRRNISFDFKARRFIKGAGLPPEERNQVWLGSFSPAEALALLAPDVRHALRDDDLLDEARAHFARAGARDTLGRLQYVDLKMYLQDGILVKVDRASMACSLEVRAPLLDHRLVELVARLPTSWKLRGMTTKYILKRAMGPWLPPGITNRPKKGFGVPVATWLRGPLKGMMLDLLAAPRLRRQGLLDPAAVEVLVRDHLEGRLDNRKPIWTLLMLQLWQEHWAGVGRHETIAA
ncbi:MAG: asparagine synthase (glutamine-hydrolyzing) [Candidatus Polarisedimenticolia bacterium]